MSLESAQRRPIIFFFCLFFSRKTKDKINCPLPPPSLLPTTRFRSISRREKIRRLSGFLFLFFKLRNSRSAIGKKSITAHNDVFRGGRVSNYEFKCVTFDVIAPDGIISGIVYDAVIKLFFSLSLSLSLVFSRFAPGATWSIARGRRPNVFFFARV